MGSSLKTALKEPSVKLNHCLALCLAISALLCFVPTTAVAGSITYSNFQFTGPIVAIGSNNDAKITNGTVTGSDGTYTLTADFCQTGFCPAGGTATDLLRVTNISLTCSSSSGTCDPIDITFSADGSTSSGTVTFDSWLTSATFTGTAPSGGYVNVCVADGSHICTSTATGTQSAQFTFGSNLLGDNVSSFAEAGSFTLVGDLHFDGVPNGTTISVPNSLEFLAISPEPSDILLFATGLAGLIALRRRKRRM